MTVRTEGGLPNPYEGRCSCSGCRNRCVFLKEQRTRAMRFQETLKMIEKAIKSKRRSRRG